MALKRRASKTWKLSDLTLSYRVAESRDRFRDCLNVFSSQDKLQTRYGLSKYNDTTLGGSVLSLSYFKNNAGTLIMFAKIGTVLYSVSASGAHTAVKTGLTATTKHRGITMNNRHIICIESDGLFQYDTTYGFTQLGQDPPTAPTAANAVGGDLAASTWFVSTTFYSSVTGFETNIGAASSLVTTALNDQINVSAINSTALNATIDKIRIYLKNATTNGSWLFVEEISLGTTTYTISNEPTSTQTPPITNAAPITGGAKYLSEFNNSLVFTGNNTFKSDVFISEQFLPDAHDDSASGLYGSSRLSIPGDGEITGIARGLYNESNLDPYLAIFKKRHIQIYSEIGGNVRFAPISEKEGCVSHDSIIIRNGNIFFLSANGWRAIVNGQLLKDEKGNAITLGAGDIDDIFTEVGYANELSRSVFSDYFSFYYSTLDQYITFTAEAGSANFNNAYVFEFNTNGFKKYSFPIYARCACVGEDSANDEVVFIGDSNGWLYTHSVKENRTDVDKDDTAVQIDAFAQIAWFDGMDISCSYNFRELILRALSNTNDISVKIWINYAITTFSSLTYSLPDPVSGFTLDVSQLDVDVLSDGRGLVAARGDINRSAANIVIGFYQKATNSNIGLFLAQLELSKNGNLN